MKQNLEAELKVGNFVIVDGKEKKWSSSDWWAVGNCMMKLEDVTPIPLTKEWMKKLKFKFDKKEGGWFFQIAQSFHSKTFICIDLHDGKMNQHLLSIVFQDTKTKKLSPEIYSVDCPFVHQLQNILLDLTDKELCKKLN